MAGARPDDAASRPRRLLEAASSSRAVRGVWTAFGVDGATTAGTRPSLLAQPAHRRARRRPTPSSGSRGERRARPHRDRSRRAGRATIVRAGDAGPSSHLSATRRRDAKSSSCREMTNGPTRSRFSATVDSDLLEAAREAVAEGRAHRASAPGSTTRCIVSSSTIAPCEASLESSICRGDLPPAAIPPAAIPPAAMSTGSGRAPPPARIARRRGSGRTRCRP